MVSRRASVGVSIEEGTVDELKAWRQRVIKTMAPRAVMALGVRLAIDSVICGFRGIAVNCDKVALGS